VKSRFVIWIALVLVCAGLCIAQQTPQSANQQADQASGSSTSRDAAGRLVQPVGIEQPAMVPETPAGARQDFVSNVKDVYFDLNRYNLTADDRATLQTDAEWLKAHPDIMFTIEGDADERGDIVYNLFLSDQRALAARDALTQLGVPENRILYANGWGKLYPVCTQSDESCWQQNRRAHLSPWPPDRSLNSRANQGSSGSGQEGYKEAEY
jgi:peptidoglycan-associated lipoprotein